METSIHLQHVFFFYLRGKKKKTQQNPSPYTVCFVFHIVLTLLVINILGEPFKTGITIFLKLSIILKKHFKGDSFYPEEEVDRLI